MDTVPLVAVLGRFDCKTDTYNVDTVPLVSVLMRFDCNTDTCVMWTLRVNPFGGCIKEV